MKENRKGHSRSYRHNRNVIIFSLLLICISCIGCYIYTNHNLTKVDEVGVIANSHLPQIEFGAQSTPLVMIQSVLEDRLLRRFLQERLFSCQEDELGSYPGLDNRVKDPVYMYEGYYHSLQTSQTVYSKNPNPMIGTDFDKPPDSSFTRAFYQAFREINKEIFDTLKHRLLDASVQKDTGKEDVCYLFAQWIDKGHHFGDLSIQIHYGQGNEQKLKSGAAWHQDAENSLLHLAVTLRGERVLHSKRTQKDSINLRTLNKHENHAEILETQRPGSVYLTSSTLMQHAPQFFRTDYSSRVIAIHARILYTSAEIDHFRQVRTKESWDELTKILANTLAASDLKVPTLAQVETQLLLNKND